MKNSNGIDEVYGKIEVVAIFTDSNYKKDAAHIKQVITTTYPSERYSSVNQDALFAEPAGESFTKERNCLIPIPKGTTKESVQKQLDSIDGCIYRKTSNNIQDFIGEAEQYAIDNGYKTLEDYIDSLETKDSEETRYAGGEVNDGRYYKEFTKTYFRSKIVNDQDLREYKKATLNPDFKGVGIVTSIEANTAQFEEDPSLPF